MLNPIIPHFAQYCWNTYVWPILSKSQNFGTACENLNTMPWPIPSAPHDKVASDKLNYLDALRPNVTEGIDKAKSGGKKKGKGKQPEETKEISKCYIFVAKEYPQFKKECLTILQKFEFNDDDEIQGDYTTHIKETYPGDKKKVGLAMGFVKFQLEIAKKEGKDAAIRLETSFDEVSSVKDN